MVDPGMGILAMLALLQEGKIFPSQSGPPGPPGSGAPPASSAAAAAPAASSPATKGAAAKGAAKPAAPAAAPSPPLPSGTVPATPGTPTMPPWPTAPVPADLPPFPGKGWIPDTPVTDAISARAAYWNPLLWDLPNKKIRKPYVQEQFGGQWVTFAAEWHPGDAGPQTFMAVEAWRQASAPPLAPSPPAAAVSPVSTSTPAQTPLQVAALAMNEALKAHGYRKADQALYVAFQKAAGLGADGFPGTHTMTSLSSALSTMGQTIAPVKVYPWSATGAYDGVNAPTQAEWGGGGGGAATHVAKKGKGASSPAVPVAAAAPTGPPAPVLPYPGPGAWQSNGAYVGRYQAALTYLAHALNLPALDPQGTDGKYGPHTQAAVKAFQGSHGLTQDGEAGADTASALDAAVAAASASVVGQDPTQRLQTDVQALTQEAIDFLRSMGFDVTAPPGREAA
jgi:Putative peptidoglycan binding domain